MAIRIKDTDNGYQAMRRNVFGKGKSRVLVGITEEVGREQHAEGRAATVLQIAIWNEFGNGLHSPERSYLRSWFDSNKTAAEDKLSAMMPALLAGEITKEQLLDRLGLWIVGEIQKTMTGDGIPPPNAPSTIAKKGSATATVEDGTLRSKITHVVRRAGEE